MKRLLVLLLFGGGLLAGAPAANACQPRNPTNPQCWAATFHGTANVDCFGCGVSTGTADLLILPGGAAAASYTVNEPAGATCVVTGSASGSVSGALNVDFNWTRVGAVAVITTAGDINGAGVAGFVVTSPVGNPCGGPITAAVTGAVAG